MKAMREADIPCYRVGHGYTWSAAGFSGRAATENQICLYVERDSDYGEANRILVKLGAVVEKPPPRWVIVAFLVAAAVVAVWVAVAWS
jgi:hypothetical protein